MGPTASQITSLEIVYSIVYSGTDQRKHQNFASLAFVREIRWRPRNSPHKWPVKRKMFPFDDVIMEHGGDTDMFIQNFKTIWQQIWMTDVMFYDFTSISAHVYSDDACWCINWYSWSLL